MSPFGVTRTRRMRVSTMGMRKGAWSRRSFQSASVAANNDPLTKVAQSPRNTIADSAGDRSAALIINAIPVT
jgi:hypothetical protein